MPKIFFEYFIKPLLSKFKQEVYWLELVRLSIHESIRLESAHLSADCWGTNT